MKKLALSILAVVLVLNGWSNATAQKAFSGTISYDIKVAGNAEAEAAMSMFKITMNQSFLGKKSKMNMSMGSMMDINTIFDADSKTGLVLMSTMGENMAVEMDGTNLNQYLGRQRQNQKPPKIKAFKKKTKKVAGYKCYRVEVTTEAEETKEPVILYITEAIQPEGISQFHIQYPGLDGYPLIIEVEKDGMTITLEAEQVSKTKPKASDFEMEIPDGYKKTTLEQLNQMNMGGNLFGM